jgi:hypothetical protein
VLLLITGASGVGKSSVRGAIAAELEPGVRCVELRDVVPIPAFPDLAWRQRSTEQAARLALELQGEGRHLLLCGDPVAPGEVLAVPSAERLETIAACLLDCRPEVQRARLLARGDPPATLPDHLAFADWMRRHAEDPAHMPEVLTAAGWERMRWERWLGWERGEPALAARGDRHLEPRNRAGRRAEPELGARLPARRDAGVRVARSRYRSAR